MNVVIDTNVLVSTLWTDKGNPRKILDMVGKNTLKICYDHRIIAEYKYVLNRPKFKFSSYDVEVVLKRIKANGLCVAANICPIDFTDETDRAFYEVAVNCSAYLITGNKKHYPDAPFIISPAQFVVIYENQTFG